MQKIVIVFFILLAGCTTLPSSKVFVAPKDGKIVVFDIDGTLTPTPMKIWSVRAGAAKAVQHYVDQGYQVTYLSARIPMFQAGIPNWLHRNGFPDGYIFVPKSWHESRNPTPFKVRILKQLMIEGWVIGAAYGDSSTDFAAYIDAGIPQADIFALKREGESQCQIGRWSRCLDGWGD
ncbi:hypothetical protein [Celerinatantimonas sp. YJH-8]|uniref:LNS2 domain-containing protein n=1 Tax=Celerinatantimonas sp. YJH-8 TaxID=3228714 RepID=UPI0038C7B52C